VVTCPEVVGGPVVLLVGAAVPGEVVLVEANVVVASVALCLDELQAAITTTSDRKTLIFDILSVSGERDPIWADDAVGGIRVLDFDERIVMFSWL
jgi:hypothetical protein